jgi:hypothetical protein
MEYRVQFEYDRELCMQDPYMKATINGVESKCRCGRRPQMLIFNFGHPVAYCHKHLPDIQEPSEIDVLAKELNKERLTIKELNDTKK